MPDARDVVRVPHCAAWLVFWIGFLPGDSALIIAFPVKRPSILLVKIRSPNLCPYPYSYPDPFLAAVTWQPPDVALMHLKAPV